MCSDSDGDGLCDTSFGLLNNMDYLPLRYEKIPPDPISNLQNNSGAYWINWTWDNPPNIDFSHVMIFVDEKWVKNSTVCFYKQSFKPLESHKITIYSVDTSGNINTNNISQNTLTAADPNKITTLETGEIPTFTNIIYLLIAALVVTVSVLIVISILN